MSSARASGARLEAGAEDGLVGGFAEVDWAMGRW